MGLVPRDTEGQRNSLPAQWVCKCGSLTCPGIRDPWTGALCPPHWADPDALALLDTPGQWQEPRCRHRVATVVSGPHMQKRKSSQSCLNTSLAKQQTSLNGWSFAPQNMSSTL